MASLALVVSCGTDDVPGGTADSGPSGIPCSSDDVCGPGVCQDGHCVAIDAGGDVSTADADDTGVDVQDRDSAEDTSVDIGDDTDTDTGGPLPGTFGSPCDDDADCDSGVCINTGAGDVCTVRCSDACPDPAWDCVLLSSDGDPIQICVPPRDVLCTECTRDLDCGGLNDFCVTLLDGNWCAESCSAAAPCPAGFSCDDTTSVNGESGRQCLPEAGVCGGCLDPDGDEYGIGAACFGGDCDELDATIFDGAPEICDGRDNDCDLMADEGFDLQNDNRHCGSCNNACVSTSGRGACFSGECRITSCNPGTYDLNGEWSDGCEYECVPAAVGGGAEVCNGVDDDCDGDIDEGFDLMNDVRNCGVCGNTCRLPGASEICVDGDCVISACEAPLLHCNSSQDDGCEVDPRTDPLNCGECGRQCTTNNGTAGCSASACVIEACVDYFADCDGLADARGCETDLRTSAAHCGACDSPCIDPPRARAGCRQPTDCSGPGCAFGECHIASCTDPNYLDCNAATPGGFADGCESDRFSITSCLSCGNRCSYPNAVAGCNESGCFLDECLPGFNNVNSSLGDGCEYACTVSNGGVEACDGIDNDCDGDIDENVPGAPVWYRDGDSDTYGDTGTQIRACEAPTGYIARGGDCNDDLPAINPLATEICDGVDNNCDGFRDEGLARDVDGDGHFAIGSCGTPADDCDDGDRDNFPGNVEACDGSDNNCDTIVDPAGSFACVTYYYDSDNDTWGTTAGPCLCAPSGNFRATRGGDCFDGSASVFPGQPLFFTSARVDGSFDYNCDLSEDPQYGNAAQACEVSDTVCLGAAAGGWRDGVPACGVTSPWVSDCFFDNTGDPSAWGCYWRSTSSRVQPCR